MRVSVAKRVGGRAGPQAKVSAPPLIIPPLQPAGDARRRDQRHLLLSPTDTSRHPQALAAPARPRLSLRRFQQPPRLISSSWRELAAMGALAGVVITGL